MKKKIKKVIKRIIKEPEDEILAVSKSKDDVIQESSVEVKETIK